MTKQVDKVTRMMESKVDLGKIGVPGDYPGLHENLVLELAVAYQDQIELNACCISWESQKKAQDYFNEHGFIETLDHLIKVQATLDWGSLQ